MLAGDDVDSSGECQGQVELVYCEHPAVFCPERVATNFVFDHFSYSNITPSFSRVSSICLNFTPCPHLSGPRCCLLFLRLVLFFPEERYGKADGFVSCSQGILICS